ncbi:hypothetical protein D3C87_1485800 [compost metagenome]
MQEYMAMGDTRMRFFNRTPRTWYGVSIGMAGRWPDAVGAPARSAIQRSKPSSQAGSRKRRFSCEMRCERVSSE